MSKQETPRDRLYNVYVSSSASELVSKQLRVLQPRLHYLRTVVREHFPQDRNSNVLDLGCGHGVLLHAAILEGYVNLTGVDRSSEQVKLAHDFGLTQVKQGDLFETAQQCADDTIDALITFDVLEHLSKDELLSLVDEVHRILKPGAPWIIHVPNGGSPFFGRIRYGDLTHELAFTQESITAILKMSGFTEITCFEDVPIVHGIKSAVRLILWRAIRALMIFYLTVETGSGAGGIFSLNLLCVARKSANSA